MLRKKNLTKEDIDVLKFLEKYKMLKVEDCSLIYKTKRYYRTRVNKLIENEFIKRYKNYIMLSKKGREYLGITGSAYIKNMNNAAYLERLKYIASIATITINSNIKFIPSWEIKDKSIYTDTARRYVGKIIIEDNDYLIYYISKKKEHVYIKQLLFDINKSFANKNIIIFVEKLDILNKNYSYLTFEKDNTYVILNKNENKQIIKQYKNIDFYDIIQSMYEEELLISDWEDADYLVNNKYIINMPYINTQKLEKIYWFYKENTNINKSIDIITLKENKEKIEEMLDYKCNVKIFKEDLFGG